MRGLQRVRGLTIEDQDLTPGTRWGLPSRKRNPRNKLHGDEDLAMDLTHFIDLHNVGMRNTGHRLRLSQGTLGSACGTLFPMEHLERDPAIELLVIRGIDRAHATRAQLTQHHKATQALRDQGLGGRQTPRILAIKSCRQRLDTVCVQS